MTWVLIIVIYVAFGGGLGITSIPGYDTQAACVAASKAVAEAKVVGVYGQYCIPGPKEHP